MGKPKRTPVSPTETPQQLAARGPLTARDVARLCARAFTSVHEAITAGDIPANSILGGAPRIEPLVAWALKRGKSKETLRAVHDRIAAGESVEQVLAFINSGDAVEAPRSRSRRQAEAATEGT